MKYRDDLPQLGDRPMLADGGMETEFIFLDGIDLPAFASIDLMRTAEGRDHVANYFRKYYELALSYGVGAVVESPTWRASHGWLKSLGYTLEELDEYNRASIEMMLALREECEADEPLVISGSIGPRSDGYAPSEIMTAAEAKTYHARQVKVLARAGADCITAMTMCYENEAIGIALAARDVGVPSVISFTVEVDGRLVTGASLEDAINRVDDATDSAPAYYMINCAHPSHFDSIVSGDSAAFRRIRGIRANASKCSHEELDNAEELDIGNPEELGRDYVRLCRLMPWLTVLGGCCGTDLRHIRAIAEARFGPGAMKQAG